MDLFKGELPVPVSKSIADYVENNDVKGLLSFLNSLSQQDFTEKALRAGFSLISFSHGRAAVTEHLIKQINTNVSE